MLPANHGDSILVEWGDDSPGAEVHRMLIDGGPYFAYPAIRKIGRAHV